MHLPSEIDNRVTTRLSVNWRRGCRGWGRWERQMHPLGNMAFRSFETERAKAMFPLVHGPQDQADIHSQRKQEQVPQWDNAGDFYSHGIRRNRVLKERNKESGSENRVLGIHCYESLFRVNARLKEKNWSDKWMVEELMHAEQIGGERCRFSETSKFKKLKLEAILRKLWNRQFFFKHSKTDCFGSFGRTLKPWKGMANLSDS